MSSSYLDQGIQPNEPTGLQKTTAEIFYNDEFLSTGVVFKILNKVYCITAGHSIYGKGFDDTKDSGNLKVQVLNHQYQVNSILGNLHFAKDHDIELMLIDCEINLLEEVSFTPPPYNKIHSLLFRGRTGDHETINNIPGNHYDEPEIGTTKYKISCKKEYLRDSTDNHGSDWLGGWSGSGLFYENKTDVHCCGIIIEVLDKGDAGKILCASIRPLQELLPELNIIDNKEFDFDQELTDISISEIINNVDVESIKEWETNAVNNDDPRIAFINAKLPHLYPNQMLNFEKVSLIKNFMVGVDYIENKLSKHETLKLKYDDAYKAFTLVDTNIIASDRREARNELARIKSDYEKYLASSLTSLGFSVPTITLLKEYAIAEWISDCSIKIFKDE